MVVPYVTRGICQKQVGRYIVTGLGLASVGAAAVAVFYMMPRFRRYEQFFKNYDGYEHMRYICATNPSIMHSCPESLVKLAEEKGRAIAEL